MPYTRSIARKEFQITVGGLCKQSKYASLKKSHIPHDIQQCVYRNAIFQSSAAIEEYVKSVLEDWIHLLHINGNKVSSIPVELVLWAAGKKQKPAFQHYIAYGDEGKFLDNMLSVNLLADLFSESALVKDVIKESEHVRDRKYPSVKNIKALFRRFGINDIFKAIQVKGKKDYKSILESFSDVRTVIAHEHPTPDITAVDVKKQLGLISDLVAKIDMVLYAHVTNTSGSRCWKINRI